MSSLTPRAAVIRVASNAASLLTTDVLNKATTFVVYALTARYLGPQAFGQLSLGLLLVYVFQVLAGVGLPNLLTREIARRGARAPRLVTSGLVVAGGTSLLAMGAMLATPAIMFYDSQTTWVICILACGLFPNAAAGVLEASFRGRQQMHLIAISNVLANSLKVAGAVWMLHHGFGTLWLAGWLVVIRVVVAVVDLGLYLAWSGQRLAGWDRRHGWRLVRCSATFLGIDAAIAGWSAVDALLLSKFMGELEVGLYCAATQLLQPAALVYLSIVGSIFPAMCQRFRQGAQPLFKLTRWMVAFLLMLGLPAVVLMIAFADVILVTAYADPQFLNSVPVMRIAALALIAQCFTTILGHALWAANREGLTLRIVVTNLLANIIISSLTISVWGLVGAATGTLLVSLLNVLQHYLAFYRVTGRQAVDAQIMAPLLAAIAMAAVMFACPTWVTAAAWDMLPGIGQWSLQQLLAVPQRGLLAMLGLVAYAGVLLSLVSLAYGGPRQLRRSFFAPLVS